MCPYILNFIVIFVMSPFKRIINLAPFLLVNLVEGLSVLLIFQRSRSFINSLDYVFHFYVVNFGPDFDYLLGSTILD